jgi:4-amino-4-deoxy-L-arabinose transferase-like glycosyltransferase
VVAEAGRAQRVAVVTQPANLALIGALLLVLAFQLWISPSNPPGFIRDEAAFALNAWTISQHLTDQDGARLPLYFVSFNDYKSPVFVYLLAAVFRLTGPAQEVARALGAVDVLFAIALVAWLAFRRTRSRAVVAMITVLVGTVPWLFELGRVAFDSTLFPAAVCLVLAVAEWASRSAHPNIVKAIPLALSLGLVSYVYAAGRLLAPLLAVAVLVFWARGRRSFVLYTWALVAVTQVPLLVYSVVHPGGLTARYEATSFVHPGMSTPQIVWRAVSNYGHDLNLLHWIRSGDPTPTIHVAHAGQLYLAIVILAAAGVVQIVRRHRTDPWWRFVLVVLLLVPIPAALTQDRFHALRLSPLPAVLCVVAIPGALLLVTSCRSSWLARGAFVALTAFSVVQFTHFVDNYTWIGSSSRQELFEAGVPVLLHKAFATPGPIYIDYDDRYAQTHALWYVAAHHLPPARVHRLGDGFIPPKGSKVFGRLVACDYVCVETARINDYWIARAEGPKP